MNRFDLIEQEVQRKKGLAIQAKIALQKVERDRKMLIGEYLSFLSNHIDTVKLLGRNSEAETVSMRKAVSKYLIDKGYRQIDIAQAMGIERSTISYYFTASRLTAQDLAWIEKINDISKEFC